MKLYSSNEHYKLYQGNMLDMLEVIEPNTIDSIITDPPYGLTSITKRFGKEDSAECQYGKDGSFQRLSKGFMGKEWDGSGIEYNIDAWRKCYEVLKPGGYLLAFGGSRTFHRIACAIEDAGFEIRDTIMWLYGSGFPKSHNIGLDIDKLNGCPDRGHRIAVANRHHPDGTLEPNGEQLEPYEAKTKDGKKWNGWGTALKPSFEPIIVARKPLDGTVAKNCLKYGVGGINIDECRVEFSNNEPDNRVGKQDIQKGAMKNPWGAKSDYDNTTYKANGRFPANTILTYDETDFDEVCGDFPNTKSTYNKDSKHEMTIHRENADILKYGYKTRIDSSSYNDSGSASRYFYCAKASKKDRDEGLDEFETKKTGELQGGRKEGSAGSIMLNADGTTRVNPYAGTGTPKKNTHPTVKPTELMQYLVRLVSPDGATILDPFNGSGSTGKAVMYENKERNKNYNYIGIELTEEYLPISKARIEYVCNLEPEVDNQLTIFDFIGEK